jgi:phosphate transport system protein
MRAAFASELAAIETRIHVDLKSAVLTLAIVADAVTGPMSVWSEAIAKRARELRRASSSAEGDLVAITARQAPVAGDLRLVLSLIQVSQHEGLIANQFDLISQQLDAIDADASDRQRTGERLSEMATLAGDQLHRAPRAFVTRDVHVARAVDRDDDAIDKLNREVFEASSVSRPSRKSGRWPCGRY